MPSSATTVRAAAAEPTDHSTDDLWTAYYRRRRPTAFGRFVVFAPDQLAAEDAARRRLDDGEILQHVLYGEHR